MKKVNLKSQALIIIGAVLWGTTGSAQAFAPLAANPLSIGALRLLVGGIALFLIALLKGSIKNALKINKAILLSACVSLAVFQPLFFMSVSKTGVAFGTVMTIGSAPIFSGIIDTLLGKKPSKNWLIATIISITGCVFLFAGNTLSFNFLGSIFALFAGLAYATYVVCTQYLLTLAPKETVNALVFTGGALLLSPILFFTDITWVTTLRGVAVVLHLGLITVALAYTLFAYGLQNLSPSRAVTLTLAEPLTASVLGILVLKEPVTWLFVIGISLVLTGLVLNSKSYCCCISRSN